MLRTRAISAVRSPIAARAAAVTLLLTAVALLAACSGASTTPNSTLLLATAGQKLTSDSAFHFVLQEDHAGSPSGDNVDVTHAEGDVIEPTGSQPVKLQAPNVTAAVGSLGSINTGVVVIGNQAWYKNPLTGSYQDAGSLSGQLQNVASLLGPGLTAVIASVKDVSAPSDSSVNGVATWKITATVSSDKLSVISQGAVPSGQQIPIQFYIGKDDGQLHQLVIAGKVTSFDTAQTTRTIMLSKFNESVTINPPTS